MTLLNDRQITKLARKKCMISPFLEHSHYDNPNRKGGKAPSFGLSCAGYDIRLGKWFDDLTKNTHVMFDGHYVLRPKTFVLAVSMEEFKIPNNIVGIAMNKSTWARTGLMANITPLEPGWSGYLTLELFNQSEHDINLYPGDGICQIMFHKIARPSRSYLSKGGHYFQQGSSPVRSFVK